MADEQNIPDAGAAGAEPRHQLNEVLGRALTDEDFRKELFDNTKHAIRNYDLSSIDREALDNLDRDKIEEAAKRVGEAQALTIEVAVSIHF
jgi:hypothetical protein